MLKRAAFAGLAVLVFGASSAHAERILNYAVEIRGQKDGALLVHETILYDFEGQKGTGIDRRISFFLHLGPWHTHTLSLRVLDAREDGMAAYDEQITDESEGAGDYFLRWHLGDSEQPISGLHRYEFRYRVEGALFAQDEAHDGWRWPVLGTYWRVPIAKARIVFVPPATLAHDPALAVRAWLQDAAGNTKPLSADIQAGRFIWTAQALSPHTDIMLEATFPRGALAAEAPRGFWQEMFAHHKTDILFWLACMGLAALWWLPWQTCRCALGAGWVGLPDWRETPPEGVDAAEAGLLVDAEVRPAHLAAAVLELAAQGHLRLRRAEADDEIPVLVPQHGANEDDALPAYKRLLLRALGSDATAKDWAKVRDALNARVMERGWFVRHSRRARLAELAIASFFSADLLYLAHHFSLAWSPQAVEEVLAWSAILVSFLVPWLLWQALWHPRAWGRWLALGAAFAWALGIFARLAHGNITAFAALLDPRALAAPLAAALFASVVLIVCASTSVLRSAKGVQTLRELLHFRRFLQQADPVWLGRRLRKDADALARVLSFAVALDIPSSRLAEIMAVLSVPDWYEGDDGHSFVRDLIKLRAQLARRWSAPPHSQAAISHNPGAVSR